METYKGRKFNKEDINNAINYIETHPEINWHCKDFQDYYLESGGIQYPVKRLWEAYLRMKDIPPENGNNYCNESQSTKLKLKFEKLGFIIKRVKENKYGGIKKMNEKLEKPALNQILYGPPGTGKTYNTIIKAMEIITFTALFETWYNKTSKAISKDTTLKSYCTAINDINKEFGINIFCISEPEKYLNLKNKIKETDYYKKNCTHAETSQGCSYTDSALNQYEKFLRDLNYKTIKIEFDKYKEHKEPNKDNYKEWYKNNNKINDKTLSDYFSDYTKYEEEGLNLFDVTSEEELKNFREKLKKSNRFKKQERHDWINALTNSYLEFYKNCIPQIEFITFHQSYSYEEFVEGIRPVIKNNVKNDIQFEYYDGIFKNICINASNHPDKKFVLIIDEINRGNISKIFGELITLIEPDKRKNVTGDETQEYHTIEVTLPYSNEKFTVPNNLYIIGTMNTADKSLTLLDVALRRRFEFIPMYPQYENIANMHYGDFLKKLNNNILVKKNYNADYLIGHSYFIGKEAQDLKNVLNKKVIPLLMEYFNGKIETVKEILDSCGYTLTYDSDYSVDGKGEKYFYLQVKKAEPKQKQNTFGEQNSKPTDEQKNTENES